jgi:hypothetical protein
MMALHAWAHSVWLCANVPAMSNPVQRAAPKKSRSNSRDMSKKKQQQQHNNKLLFWQYTTRRTRQQVTESTDSSGSRSHGDNQSLR